MVGQISSAVQRYLVQHPGHAAITVLINPSDLSNPIFKNTGLPLRSSRYVLPGSFWIGEEVINEPAL